MEVHSDLKYVPKGYIYVKWNPGGFNNQLEQLWVTNLLCQLTNRGWVEETFRLEDRDDSPRVNISEIVDRKKYLSNLPVIQLEDFNKYCGPYTQLIKLPDFDWSRYDEFEYFINQLAPHLGHCVVLEHFPPYNFYSRDLILNWVPQLTERVIQNFEFSDPIISQTEDFAKKNSLTKDNFITVQFRRGDFESHCKNLYNSGSTNWAFGYLYDKAMEQSSTWEQFESHCYPTIDRMVQEIVQFNKKLNRPVTKVLFLTNAKKDEIDSLKAGLSKQGLEFIRFEPNMELAAENSVEWTNTHSLTAEMQLAKFCNYFIGNRHSTISTNIIGLKMPHFEFENNHFI